MKKSKMPEDRKSMEIMNNSCSVSMEAVMDTITRVYLGVTVMLLAAQITFPFYNHLKTSQLPTPDRCGHVP